MGFQIQIKIKIKNKIKNKIKTNINIIALMIIVRGCLEKDLKGRSDSLRPSRSPFVHFSIFATLSRLYKCAEKIKVQRETHHKMCTRKTKSMHPEMHTHAMRTPYNYSNIITYDVTNYSWKER